MLVVLPVTFYITTLIGDVASLATRQLFWVQLAWFTNLMAVGFAALAAIAGLVEFTTIPRKTHAQRTAIAHGLLNVGIVVLFTAALIFRSPEGFSIPDVVPEDSRMVALTVLSLIGVGALTVAGWLGWDLVYHHRIGVTPAAEKITTRYQKGPIFNEPGWEAEPRNEEERPPNPKDAH
jgi:uncharacterized membrane protein